MSYETRDIFIIGAKSVGQYGGYETFVDKLTEAHQNDPSLRYHITTKMNGSGHMDETKLDGVSEVQKDKKGNVTSFRYHNAEVFKLRMPEIGGATAILYDIKSFRFFLKYCKAQDIKDPVFYILACRIGPLIRTLKHRLKKLGGKLYLNPDGHEWKRSKWPGPVRLYWKLSERMMVKHADLVICDARAIEEYIHSEYPAYDPRTTYISYGAEIEESALTDDDPAFTGWLKEKGLRPFGYDLNVGRLVPENNYETMIREYMHSTSERKLVLITDLNKKYLRKLEKKLHYSKDPRIVFAGPLYQPELLKKIRENAYLYFHGHSVGGTNPSLLEALGSAELCLLYDVSFNREVAGDAALYWTLEEGNFAALIGRTDEMDAEARAAYGQRAKDRIRELYSWDMIAGKYKNVFLDRALEEKETDTEMRTADETTGRIQEACKKMLAELVRICEKYNIRYYLIDGSMLGAVRHQGFIPWDDDMDIAMPRPDYERFVAVAPKELPDHMYFVDYEESLKGNSFGEIAHIFSRDLKLETEYFSTKRTTDVWIDIMILYGMPKGEWKEKRHYRRYYFYKGFARMGRIENIGRREYTAMEHFFISFAQKVRLDKVIDTEKVLLKSIRLLKEYDYDTSEDVLVVPSEYGIHEMVPRAWYSAGRDAAFEDLTVKIPEQAEKILTQLYGDYMTPPPEEERRSKHIVHIIEAREEDA